MVEDAIGSEDDRKIWSFVKSLSGTPAFSPTREVLKIGTDRLVSNKAKANAFSKHYASVSRLAFSKEGLSLNCTVKQLLRSVEVSDEGPCSQITMPELEKAIKKMCQEAHLAQCYTAILYQSAMSNCPKSATAVVQR